MANAPAADSSANSIDWETLFKGILAAQGQNTPDSQGQSYLPALLELLSSRGANYSDTGIAGRLALQLAGPPKTPHTALGLPITPIPTNKLYNNLLPGQASDIPGAYGNAQQETQIPIKPTGRTSLENILRQLLGDKTAGNT